MGLPREKPDAVLVPRPFGKGGSDDHALLKAKFAKLLGVSRVYTSNQGNQYFVRGNPDLTLVYPVSSPLNPSEQLDWYVVQDSRDHPPLAEPVQLESWADRPETIKFGYIKDTDRVDPPSAAVKDEFMRAHAAQQIDYYNKSTRSAELTTKLLKEGPTGLDSAEKEELSELQAFFQRWAENGPPSSPDHPISGL